MPEGRFEAGGYGSERTPALINGGQKAAAFHSAAHEEKERAKYRASMDLSRLKERMKREGRWPGTRANGYGNGPTTVRCAWRR